MEVFRCGGHGGQNLQKNSTGVRIKHPASGAVGESREERSQLQNKKTAFNRCVNSEKFKLWHKIETAKIMMGKREWEAKIQREVEKMMEPQNLNIEFYDPDHPELTKKENKNELS